MKYLAFIMVAFSLAACTASSGAAPQPPTSDDSGISGGTANDIYHGAR